MIGDCGPILVCTLLGIFCLIVMERAFNMMPTKAVLACSASATLHDIEFHSGDILLCHSFAPICFFTGTPWSHVAFVLVDAYGQEYMADMTPKGNIRLRDLRTELLRLMHTSCNRIAMRRVSGAEVNSSMLFDFVLRNSEITYSHTYINSLLSETPLWFATMPPPKRKHGGMFCSTFVAKALAHAGVMRQHISYDDLLPHEFTRSTVPYVVAPYTFSDLTLLHC
jgi:hypothetical protein